MLPIKLESDAVVPGRQSQQGVCEVTEMHWRRVLECGMWCWQLGEGISISSLLVWASVYFPVNNLSPNTSNHVTLWLLLRIHHLEQAC